MSMYLPNPDLQPTGFEPAEFIDIPTTVEEDHTMDTHRRQSGPAYLRGMLVSSWTDATMHRRPLSDQTRVNITRRAEEYIAGLVRDHHGDSEDVRSVIHDLHLHAPFPRSVESRPPSTGRGDRRS